MRRRQYLMGVGIGIGLGGAFPLGVSQAAAELERVMPDDEVTVQPGTTVLFELAVPDGVEPHDVEWDTDDDLGRTVFAGDYASETGNAAFAPSFDTSGSYEVRANPPAGDPVTWTVDVDDEGHGRPVVEELSTEPGTNETVGTDQSVEVTATVYDPAGNLGQVVWIEGRNQTVVDRSSLDGGRDTATLAFEETPSWIDFGYPTAAIVVSDDGRVSDQTSDDGPEVRQPLAVSIVETNDPVGAGEDLEVTVEVENVGDVMMVGDDSQAIELVVGDDVVDTETVTVPWNETETIALSHETFPVQQDVEFLVEVRSEDDTEETTVSVLAEATHRSRCRSSRRTIR